MKQRTTTMKDLGYKKLDNSLFGSRLNFDLFTVVFGVLITALTFIYVPPLRNFEWWLEIIQSLILFFCVCFFISTTRNYVNKKRLESERIKLEEQAVRNKVDMGDFLQIKIKEIVFSIEKWARLHNIKFRTLTYSPYVMVVDFKNFLVDFVEIRIVNYRFMFLVRFNNSDWIKDISKIIKTSKLKIVMMMDDTYLGCLKKIKINDEGICQIKESLIKSILDPSQSFIYT